MARPTKYSPELLDKAAEYISNYSNYEHAFPSDIGLADVLGIGTTTLYRWAEEEGKEAFRDILDAINRKQQIVAWQKGLTNEYNANLVKLLLGKHGYHDKQDTVHGFDDSVKDLISEIDGNDTGLPEAKEQSE